MRVPPLGIGTGVDQTNNEGTPFGFSSGLFHPSRNFFSIGWIKKDPVLRPILSKSILLLGKKQLAFGIEYRRTRIERKLEFPV
jgi:hypothetical protein